MQKSTKVSESPGFALTGSLAVVFNLGCTLEFLGEFLLLFCGGNFLNLAGWGTDSDLIGLEWVQGFSIFCCCCCFEAQKEAFILLNKRGYIITFLVVVLNSLLCVPFA